jgi:MYXO-CTERM domain-containing protein
VTRGGRRARPWRLVFAVALGGLLAARPARAACTPPDLLEAIPADGATISANASLFAHYASTAEYVNEDVTLETPALTSEIFSGSSGDPTHPSPVSWDATQGLLTFAPAGGLPPGRYTLHWPSLRGLNVAAPGRAKVVTFTVAATTDDSPPTFDGVTAVRWYLERANNDCTDGVENRFVFDLDLAPADDGGGRDGLTLLVFQTAGVLADGGSVPVLATAMPAVGKGAQVKLPVADATGHVCFAALARDLTGKISNGGSHSVCVETTAPPFFRGCALAPTSPNDTSVGGVGLLALAALVARRRASRRRG